VKHIFHVTVNCNPTINYKNLVIRLEAIIREALGKDYDQDYFDHGTVKVLRKRILVTRIIHLEN